MKKLFIGLPILFVLLNGCTGKHSQGSIERETELKKLQIECKSNNYQSCAILGMHYAYRVEDYSTAKIYYEKACNANNGIGCSGLANLYYRGLGVEMDSCKANKYFIKSCNSFKGKEKKDMDFSCKRNIRKTFLNCEIHKKMDTSKKPSYGD